MGSHSYLQNLCSGSACNQMKGMYLINLADLPPMPESNNVRPWTQESWVEWNRHKNDVKIAHPDQQFYKEYKFEPFLMML